MLLWHPSSRSRSPPVYPTRVFPQDESDMSIGSVFPGDNNKPLMRLQHSV